MCKPINYLFVIALAVMCGGLSAQQTQSTVSEFAGRIQGMVSYHSNDELKKEESGFFVGGENCAGCKGILRTAPLYLIDGVEVTKEDLAAIHLDDIESFSVLKDSSAVAIYGEHGTNGVILVTTKSKKMKKQLVEMIESEVKKESTTINIYPNPTTDIFSIECENSCIIKLYDRQGKELLTQNASEKTTVNISHLQEGIYFVKVLSDGRIVGTGKVVKQ
jgi:TonB-dependent SusC/RagA subfamily outer membrane receptor